MSDMVDKIAAVLYGGNLEDCYHPEMFRRLARRVLECVYEPTDAVLLAGMRVDEVLPPDEDYRADILAAWHRMIDAALAGTPRCAGRISAKAISSAG